jgi:hypothetical protein
VAKLSKKTLSLLGTRSGKLTAIKIISKDGKKRYLCECDCGNKKAVQVGHFKAGSTKSCGCSSRIHDLTGKIYGTLTVINRAPNSKRQTYWNCICSCGTRRPVSASRLVGGIKSCGCRHPTKRRKINDNFLEDLTLKSLYWAGFIAADGCLQKSLITIVLKRSDREHLVKLKNDLDSEATISDRNSRLGEKLYPQSCLKFTSTKIASKLRDLNITSNKSCTLKPPDASNWALPMKAAFLRGYIDGDGCIYFKDGSRGSLQLNLVGTYDFLSWAKKVFEEILNKKIRSRVRPSKRGSKSFQFNVHGRDAEKLLDYIQRLDSPCLDRKWNKFTKFIEEIRERSRERIRILSES